MGVPSEKVERALLDADASLDYAALHEEDAERKERLALLRDAVRAEREGRRDRILADWLDGLRDNG